MIDISEHITQILQPLNVIPYFNTVPPGTDIPDKYITFFEINANPELEAGDKELETGRLIQINIWSKKNYHSLVKQVRDLLEESGYERTIEYDAPKQEGDSHFNKVLRFVFFDEY